MKTSQTKSLIILVVVAILTMANIVKAETLFSLTDAERKRQQLSVRFSNLTGYGAAYQCRILKNTYARTTLWFQYYEYIKGDLDNAIIKRSNINYNFGLDLQQNIISRKQYRVYGFLGAGYAIKEKIDEDISDPNSGLSNRTERAITAGAGGGIEYYFNEHLSADFGVSYKFNANEIDKKLDIEDESIKETGLGIIVGINLNF